MIEPLRKPRPLPLADGDPPALYVYPDVIDEIRFNGGWQPRRLACGLLVGRHFRAVDDDSTYVECEGFLAGTHVEDLADFTRDLRMQWKAAAGLIRGEFGDAELIGWYASQPALGPPGNDAVILHNTFFNHAWQTGLWLDLDAEPVAVRAHGDKLQTSPIGVLGDR